MKKTIRLLTLPSITLLLFACNFAKKDSDVTFEEDFEEYRHESLYAISVPNYLTKTTSLNDEASLQFQNMLKEAYLIVIDEPKDEFIDVFTDLESYDNSLSTIQNYAKVQKDFIMDALIVNKEYPSKSTMIHGMPAIIEKFDGTTEGIDVAYKLLLIEGNETLYMVMAWTLQNRRDRFEKPFNMAFQSFKELKK